MRRRQYAQNHFRDIGSDDVAERIEVRLDVDSAIGQLNFIWSGLGNTRPSVDNPAVL